MSQVLVTEQHLTDIADAIRTKKNVEITYRPGDMAEAINSIVSANLDTLSVNANGTYTPTSPKNGFSQVDVDVPNSYTASDEGKVVSNGTLVAQGSQTITENGTYDTTLKNEVVINVSGGGGGEDVEPVLPSEYQEVEYIDFDGNSYVTINSRYVQSGDIYETAMQYITNDTSENSALGSSVSGSGPRFDFYFMSGKVEVYSGDCTARGTIDNNLSVYTKDTRGLSNKSVALNDKVYAMIEFNSFTASRYLQIGAYGNSTRYKNRLFKIKHSIVSDTVGDVSQNSFFEIQRATYTWFKPCYRKADNTPGWYDTTNDVFYTNEGTGTFVVGPDVV